MLLKCVHIDLPSETPSKRILNDSVKIGIVSSNATYEKRRVQIESKNLHLGKILMITAEMKTPIEYIKSPLK
jgi:hypothetical protein